MKKPLAILAILAGLIVIGLAGLVTSMIVTEETPRSLSATGSSPDQIPVTPTSEAPPVAAVVKAQGCTQRAVVTLIPSAGLLVQNVGTIQLRLTDGPLPTPTWPLAAGAWVHFRIGSEGKYRITGTRYTCSAAGIPPPHFQLDVTVLP